jgi:hypothetical protein
MSTILKATNLPGSISSGAASNISFAPVLQIPANLVNRAFQVRAGGVFKVPAGVYTGSLSVEIAGQASNGLIVGGNSDINADGTPKNIPFQLVANLYCDPFLGVVMDVSAPRSIFAQPGVAFTSQQSAAVVGEVFSGVIARPFGGGSLSFSSTIPLVVLVNLFNSGSSSASPSSSDGTPVLPTITGLLNAFELEY